MFKNKKGFTIVELVIVIAVIAILASVLIPTFSGVVAKANSSAALQSATSAMKATLAMSEYGVITENTQFVIVKDSKPAYLFDYKNNAISANSQFTGTVTPMNGWNAVIIHGTTPSPEEDGPTTVGDTDIALIKAATGRDGSGYTVQDSNNGYYVLAKDGKYLTATGDPATEKADALKIFVNTDYPKDLVTITLSK